MMMDWIIYLKISIITTWTNDNNIKVDYFFIINNK